MKGIWILLTGLLVASAHPANADDVTNGNEQAVIIHFKYGSTDLKPLFALEDKLESTVKGAGVGVLDGDEIANDGRDGDIYLYGQNADRLFDAIRPVLMASPFMKGAQVTRRYGPPGESTRQVVSVIDQ